MGYFIYFCIIVFANTLGAISGMGGGVIIKPSLDFLGFHTLNAINFYSSVAVFTMSIVSIFRQIKQGFKMNVKFAILVSIGSILGGILGNETFNILYYVMDSSTVKFIQIIITIILLVLVLIYTNCNIKTYQFKNPILFLLVGLLLGYLSTLLGIGGGPINVSLLMFLFGIDIKESVVYSIVTIFFSQIAKLSVTVITLEFLKFDLVTLLFIILAAIIGGYLGTKLNKKLPEKIVLLIFQLVCGFVIILNVVNIFR